MTFFDVKVADFVIKMSNCKKCAKPNGGAHRAELKDFWKNMAKKAQVETQRAASLRCHGPAYLYPIFAASFNHQQLRPTRTRDLNMNDYYFYVAPNEEDLGWEFTIRELIESEFEAHPDNFPNKSEKIGFLKELISDIEECIERIEHKR